MLKISIFLRSIEGLNFVPVCTNGNRVIARTPDRVLEEKSASQKSQRKVIRPSRILRPGSEYLEPPVFNTTNDCSTLTIEGQQRTVEAAFGSQLPYRKIKDGDVDFAKMMREVTGKASRGKSSVVLLEGKRLITDAILAGAHWRHIIFSDVEALKELPIVEGEGELLRIRPGRMRTWSQLDAPPGLMAIFEKPSIVDIDKNRQQTRSILPISVICDNIRDPSNMGGILRSVTAAGVEKILIPKGCVDVWDSKVLRGAMGAHFRVPLFTDVRWNEMLNYIPGQSQIYIADSNSFEIISEAESYKQPAPPTLSSMREEEVDSDEEDFSDSDDDEDAEEVAATRRRKRHTSQPYRLPVYRYDQVDYTVDDNIVLIVGGETQGISQDAYEIAHATDGKRIHISMGNNIGNINASAAMAVILFDMKRQMDLKRQRVDSRSAVVPPSG